MPVPSTISGNFPLRSSKVFPPFFDQVQLISKRDNLIEKFKEAQSIKESSDTRRRQLADCLQKHLTATEFLDYRQLLKTKCQLKIVRHTLEDRASLSEEQIKILVAIIEKNTSARYCWSSLTRYINEQSLCVCSVRVVGVSMDRWCKVVGITCSCLRFLWGIAIRSETVYRPFCKCVDSRK